MHHFQMEIPCCLTVLVYALAAITIVRLALYLITFLVAVYAYKLRKFFLSDDGRCPEISNLVKFQVAKSRTLYALITGSTDGIGLAYAKALARMGLNIVIVGRNDEKIDNAMKMVAEENKVQVRSLKVDFNEKNSDTLYDYIEDKTKDIEVAVLVNNVGVSYPYPMDYQNVSTDFIDQIVRVNALSVARMCRIFVPRMLEQSKEYRPVIINVSSIAALMRCAQYAAYGATKSFMNGLTGAIIFENQSKNITVQCVMPGLVATKMTALKKGSLIAAMPDEFVGQALSSLGILKESFGCLSHHVQTIALSFLPDFILRQILESNRRQVMRRLKRQQEAERSSKEE